MMLLTKTERLISKARLSICIICKDYNNGWCGKKLIKTNTTCGCFLAAKVIGTNQNCPQKKW